MPGLSLSAAQRGAYERGALPPDTATPAEVAPSPPVTRGEPALRDCGPPDRREHPVGRRAAVGEDPAREGVHSEDVAVRRGTARRARAPVARLSEAVAGREGTGWHPAGGERPGVGRKMH